MSKQNIIITGGMGFIGSHFVEHVFRKTNWNIIIIDKLSYASGGYDRIRDMGIINSDRIKIFPIDLSSGPITVGIRKEIGVDVSYIVHLAADTHVDRSISDPVPFIKNNVMSTVYLLEYARTLEGLKKFFFFSTDEVYGPAPGSKSFKETDPHFPTNPYSGSKSASEQLCLAYKTSYDCPVIIVNVMNAMGERQHVEKFVPKVIDMVLSGKEINIHADKECKIIGSRFYIHARNIADAVLFLVKNGVIGEKYNITGEKEVNNLELAEKIAKIIGKELKYRIVDAETDRKGHDIRYSLNGNKLCELGWVPPMGFELSLEKTVKWTIENREWLNKW